MAEQLNENIKKINEIPPLKKVETENIVLPKATKNQSNNEASIKLPAWSIEPPLEIARGQKWHTKNG